MSQQGDDSLSGRFRAGDESVLRDVWERHGHTLARRLLGKYRGLLEPCDAEDIVNAALDQAWRNRESFDSSRPLVAWLWRIVYTRAVSHFRGRDTRNGREIMTAPSLLDLRCIRPPGDDDGVSTIHRCGISSEELWAAVYRLPPHWQAIVRAHARAPNGRANNRLLAKELGLTVGTVREYHRRAMARLKHELGLLVAEREKRERREQLFKLRDWRI